MSNEQEVKKPAPAINKDGIVRELTEEIRKDESLSHLNNIRLEDVNTIVTLLFKRITRNLIKGLNFKLVGFGTLYVHKRKEHMANKPNTTDKVHVKESYVVKLRCGKPLKAELNANYVGESEEE